MRKLVSGVAIALIVASCGGSGEPAATSSPTATSDGAATDATAGSQTTSASVDGPAAPDFDLVLGDGTTFSLSGEEKPVYMVFWAEW
jgi:hypothetical protein